MKQKTSESIFSIALTPNELYYLANLFGPGLVFGLEERSDNLDEKKIKDLADEAYTSLSKVGLVKKSNNNQILIDELLSGMIYYCVHSNHVLIVKDVKSGKERFFHFLPDWQLEFVFLNNKYELTLFRERADLFQHICDVYNLNPTPNEEGLKFSINAEDLELSIFLLENGKSDKATEIVKEKYPDFPEPERFLIEYNKSINDLRFDLIFDREDKEKVRTKTRRLVEISGTYYWITYSENNVSKEEELIFSPVTLDQAEWLFNQLLP